MWLHNTDSNTVVRNQVPPQSHNDSNESLDDGQNAQETPTAIAVGNKMCKSKKRHYKNFSRRLSFNTSKGVQNVCKQLFHKILQVSHGRVERARDSFTVTFSDEVQIKMV